MKVYESSFLSNLTLMQQQHFYFDTIFPLQTAESKIWSGGLLLLTEKYQICAKEPPPFWGDEIKNVLLPAANS